MSSYAKFLLANMVVAIAGATVILGAPLDAAIAGSLGSGLLLYLTHRLRAASQGRSAALPATQRRQRSGDAAAPQAAVAPR